MQRNLARARALYQRACVQNNQRGCTFLGVLQSGDSKEQAEAGAKLLVAACNKGDALGCLELAVLEEGGSVVPKDLQHAKQLLEAACKRLPEACAELGNLYDKGEGVPANPAHARELSAGDVVPEDDARALKYLAQACDAKRPIACAELGTFFDIGRGVPKDLPRALTLYDQACRADAPVGCLWLGLIYRDGKVLHQDLPLARSLNARGCSAKTPNADGCFYRAEMESRGVGGPVDAKAAAQGYEAACALGNARACQMRPK